MLLNSQQIATLQAFFDSQPVLRAWLFGSYSRGDAQPDSDIDLLVELDYTQPIGLEFIQMKIDIQQLLNQKIDLVSINGLSKYIKPMIEQEKQLIYAR